MLYFIITKNCKCFSGIGVCGMMISFLIQIYYSCVLGWVAYYLGRGMVSSKVNLIKLTINELNLIFKFSLPQVHCHGRFAQKDPF